MHNSMEVGQKVDQLVFDSLVKSAEIVLQRGAPLCPIIPEEYQGHVSPHPAEYCTQVISTWRNTLTAPLDIEMYFRISSNSNKRVLVERWSFQYSRRDGASKDSNRLGSLNRRLITFWRALYSFVRLLPGFQILKFMKTQPQIDFEILNPKMANVSQFDTSTASYEFPDIQTPNGALQIGVKYVSEAYMVQVLQMTMAFAGASRTNPIPIHESSSNRYNDDVDSAKRRQLPGRAKSESHMTFPRQQSKPVEMNMAGAVHSCQSPQVMRGKHDAQSERVQRHQQAQLQTPTNLYVGHSKSLDSKPEGMLTAIAGMSLAEGIGDSQSAGYRRRSESGSSYSGQSPPFALTRAASIGTPCTSITENVSFSYDDTPGAAPAPGSSPPFNKANMQLLSTSPQTAAAFDLHAMREGLRRPSLCSFDMRAAMEGGAGSKGWVGAPQACSRHGWSESLDINIVKHVLPNSPFDLLSHDESAASSYDTIRYNQLGSHGLPSGPGGVDISTTNGKTLHEMKLLSQAPTQTDTFAIIHPERAADLDRKRSSDCPGSALCALGTPTSDSAAADDVGAGGTVYSGTSQASHRGSGDADDDHWDDDDMPFALSIGRDRDTETGTGPGTGCSSLSNSTLQDHVPLRPAWESYPTAPALLQHGVPTVPPPLLSFRETTPTSYHTTSSQLSGGMYSGSSVSVPNSSAVFAQLQDFKAFRSTYA